MMHPRTLRDLIETQIHARQCVDLADAFARTVRGEERRRQARVSIVRWRRRARDLARSIRHAR